MRSGHVKAFALVAAAELAFLAVVVAVVLQSGQHTQFPAAVPVVGTSQVSRASIPVSVTLRAVGDTKTAALVSRGGHAAATTSGSDTGVVAKRRTIAPG